MVTSDEEMKDPIGGTIPGSLDSLSWNNVAEGDAMSCRFGTCFFFVYQDLSCIDVVH